MGTSTAPLLDALDALRPSHHNCPEGKVLKLFGDRPDVLDKIAEANQRGASNAQIAAALSQFSQDSVSDKAVAWYIRKYVA
jgi:hypothetical protein